MINFLLVISFILHLVSIFAIIILYQRRTLERVSLPSMKDDVETIHESIQSFVDELEKENEFLYEKLIEYVKKKQENTEKRLEFLETRIQEIKESAQLVLHSASELYEINPSDEEKRDRESDITHSEPKKLETVPESTISDSQEVEEPKPINKDEKYQRVLELYQQGFSVEQIAKVLQIGKGEATLIVNIVQKQKSAAVKN